MYQEVTTQSCATLSGQPHQQGVFSKLTAGIGNWFAIRKQRRIDRLAFQHMLTLDDSTLRDIGVSRNDVIWASNLPLSANASLELQKLSLGNRRRS